MTGKRALALAAPFCFSARLIPFDGLVLVAGIVLFAGPAQAQIQWAGEAVISLDASDLPLGDVTSWANKGATGGSFVPDPIPHYPATHQTPHTVTASAPGSSGKTIHQVNFGPTPNWYWDMRPMTWDRTAPASVTGGESFTLEVWHNTTKTTAEGVFSMGILDSTSDPADPLWDLPTCPTYGGAGIPEDPNTPHDMTPVPGETRGGYPPVIFPNAVESAQFSGNESRVRINVATPGPFAGSAVPANTWTLQTYVYDEGTIRMYINGRPDAVFDQVWNIDDDVRVAIGSAQVNRYPFDFGYYNGYEGGISKVRLHAGALTDEQVLANFNAEAPDYVTLSPVIDKTGMPVTYKVLLDTDVVIPRLPMLHEGAPPPTWSKLQGPTGLTIDPDTGVISWPGASPLGTYTCEVEVRNLNGFDSVVFYIEVAEPPPPPPGADELLFAVDSTSILAPDGASTGNWQLQYLEGDYVGLDKTQFLAPINSPKVEVIDDTTWVNNAYAQQTGFSLTHFTQPVPIDGASIVAVVRPKYDPVGGEPRGEIVDFYYSMLALSVDHGDGLVRVCRGNYDFVPTGYNIPDGEKTILSLVVQPTGEYKVYANGVEVASVTTVWDMSNLLPDEAWKDAPFTVGRNWWDGWSTFNGNIGDVYAYRIALDDDDRQALEASLAEKFGVSLSLAPSPPRNLVATGGSKQVNLAWEAPAAGTPPTAYLIFRGAAQTQIAEVPAPATTYVDADASLIPGTLYCYTVKSKAGAQTSDPSNESCATPTGVIFHRGDADASGNINITDGIFILNYLFLGGPVPTCLEAANVDDDLQINITDGINVLNFLFLGGKPPADPGPIEMPCGPDPAGSPKDLTCAKYEKCGASP